MNPSKEKKNNSSNDTRWSWKMILLQVKKVNDPQNGNSGMSCTLDPQKGNQGPA